ncbi:hypothetical protein Tco_1368636 [Tanacetum coccineum]
MEDDKKTDQHKEVEVDDEAELKNHMKIVKDDDIAIDAIPLATKPPGIVEYKLIREGIMGHYQLEETKVKKNRGRRQRLLMMRQSRRKIYLHLLMIHYPVVIEIKSSNASLGAQEDASKQGRSIEDTDADAERNITNGALPTMYIATTPTTLLTTIEKDKQSTKLDDSTTGEAVTTASVEDSAAPTIQVSTADIGGVTAAKIDELTLAQTLIEIKVAKPKVVITTATTTTTTSPPSSRAEEKRRKPPTKAQKRNQMFTYLKNMGGYKHNQLKSKSFKKIQKMFENEMRRVNTFIPMDSEVVKSKKEIKESSKGTKDNYNLTELKKAKVSEEKTKSSRKKMLGRKRARKEQQVDKRFECILPKSDEEFLIKKLEDLEAEHQLVLERVVSGNNYTRVNYNDFDKKAHPSAHKNMVPRTVLMKIDLRSLNTARPVNTTHSKTIVYSARPMSLLGLKRHHGFLRLLLLSVRMKTPYVVFSLKVKEVILFYNGLEVPTRQILDSRGGILTKTDADAKVVIQEMAEYSQKWHNGTSRTRSTETSDGLAAIQA